MVAALAAPGAAAAGSYEVSVCADAPSSVNNAWSYTESGVTDQLEHGSGCGQSGELGGLWVRDRLGDFDTPADGSGYWQFQAPNGTTISAWTGSRWLRARNDPDFRMQQLGDGFELALCQGTSSNDRCDLGVSGGEGFGFASLNASTLRVGFRCTSSPVCINGATIHHAQAVMYGATVTINDPDAPQITAGPSGSLFGGGWLRGVQSAQVTGRDATGVKTFELLRGTAPVKTDARACDYTYPVPCGPASADIVSAFGSIDTGTVFADGTYQIAARVTDSAGNQTTSPPTTLRVDNTPPIGPLSLAASDNEVWSTSAMRSVNWTVPGGQVAPITATKVSVCKDGGGCFTPPVTGTSAAFTLPSQGRWVVAVGFTDAAGNTTTTPGTTAVGYDTSTPVAPVLGEPRDPFGYGNFEIPADLSSDPGPAPIASLTGEACPTDGGACQPVVSTGSPPDKAQFNLPRAGKWTIAVRAVDAAGNTGPSSGAVIDYVVVPAPTATPTAGVTATPTPSDTATPTPTPTPTPPAVRRTPQLRLTRARLKRRAVEIRGVLSRPATGAVTIRVQARKRTATKTVKVRNGTFAARVRLGRRQRGTDAARVKVRYGGDTNYAPRATTVSLER